MTQTLELLHRHREEINGAAVTWLDTPLPSNLIKPQDSVYNLNCSPLTRFTTESLNITTSALNILHYPKAKDRLAWWAQQLRQQLHAGQRCWIVGENQGGIKSLPKRLADTQVSKLDSARHCSLFEVTFNADRPADINFWTHFTHDQFNGFALPGVFSAGRLDKGTEILLSVLPELKGSILEFGSGCGILTSALAAQSSVDHVDAVDIDLLAIHSARRTLDENQLTPKTSLYWSEGTAQLPKRRYDAIVTNPPFHQGLKTTYAPTEAFFAQAHQWLNPGGSFIWVINDFLNYQSQLAPAFHKPEELTRQRGFKVEKAVLA